jgi:RNA polymerase sigma-70 factor, ECF subfamily
VRNLLTGRRISASREIDQSQMSGQPGPDWKAVVEQIRAGEPPGEEELYRNLATGARLFLQRRLGTQDVEDLVHDLFVIVVETIRRGDLREPERLMGFVRTVLHRQMSLGISRMIHKRETSINLDSAADLTAAEPTPEQRTATHQKAAIMKQVLRKMSARDREVLTRFYLREESTERIRREMSLTETQFNLLKSRAKARLTELVQRRLARYSLSRE